MDKMAKELKKIFLEANNELLEKDKLLFELKVSERTICGALMNKIYEKLKYSNYSNYYVDVEYNRNRQNPKQIKTCYVSNCYYKYKEIKINCDLIVHSRGKNVIQDNLIAIEMKKSNRIYKEKENDKERLIALTKDTFDDVWSYDGKALPEQVCRYKLGIYYEINFLKKEIYLEYYYKGEKNEEEKIKIV